MEVEDESNHSMECLQGDVLESVLLRVPPQDLMTSASLVSWEWRWTAHAIRRRQLRRTCVSLVVHIQGAGIYRSTQVYDPRSQTWVAMPLAHVSTMMLPPLPVRCCAGGDRLYTLSLACITISLDALGTTWREVEPPRVWRVDPVVALVGPYAVVLGGACRMANGSANDVGVVEVHDDEADVWRTCGSMPAAFNDSASATWLSAAASDRRVYVVERRSGWASWFEPESRQWGPTQQLRPDIAVSAWAVGIGRGERLVLAGAQQEGEGLVSKNLLVKLWSADGETLEVDAAGGVAMPTDMSERLFGANGGELGAKTMSIGLCTAPGRGGGYVYNASEPRNGAVMYELSDVNATAPETEKKGVGKVERWEWVACPQAVEENYPMAKVVFGYCISGSD